MTNRLEGRTVIVTGGGHGIGRAYAEACAAEGAAVVIAEIDGTAATNVADAITASGGAALGLKVDVSSSADLATMAQQTKDRFGRIDVLINNAAIFASVPMSRGGFESVGEEEWDAMMRVNLKGPWLACRAVIPQMRAQGYGKIVNISSGTAIKGAATRIHYVSSKAGIIGFTKTLALEVGDDNICVNCVAPGSTLAEEDPDADVVKYRTGAASKRALKRVQTPADLTGAIVFFASAESDFITGQTLVVDGGSCLH